MLITNPLTKNVRVAYMRLNVVRRMLIAHYLVPVRLYGNDQNPRDLQVFQH